MVTAILTVVAGLLAALPQILKMIEARQTRIGKETDALTQRSIDELHAATDRMLDTNSSVQP